MSSMYCYYIECDIWLIGTTYVCVFTKSVYNSKVHNLKIKYTKLTIQYYLVESHYRLIVSIVDKKNENKGRCMKLKKSTNIQQRPFNKIAESSPSNP